MGDLAQLDRARVCLRLRSRHSSMALWGPFLTAAKPEALSPFTQNPLEPAHCPSVNFSFQG